MFRQGDLSSKWDALSRSQAMIEFAPDGTILFANENFLKVVGYTWDEIRGRNHSMFVDETERAGEGYRHFWEALRDGRFQRAEFRRIGKDGREIWIRASYNPVCKKPGGKPFMVLKVATDVTAERLKSADAAGQVAAIHRAQAVIEFDLAGTILGANDNFLAVIGYRLDEIVGRHHSMFMPPEERNGQAYRDFWQALGAGAFKSGRFRRVGRDGRTVWIQATYNAILDMSGRPFKVVKFSSDITQEVEDEMKRAAASRAIDGDLSEVAAIITTLNRDATTAAAASTQASTNVQAVASGSEELAASVSEISRQVSQARAISSEAVEQGRKSNALVGDLSMAAQRIGDVVQLIQTIAGQTNLLALNATIEAARAGEAGRGFAVVASEVKALAGQTAKATEEISSQIAAVQSATDGVVTVIGGITSTIATINDISSAIAAAVEEQSAVTDEMSANMRTAADGVATISANMNAIAQSSHAIDEATIKIRAISQQLR